MTLSTRSDLAVLLAATRWFATGTPIEPTGGAAGEILELLRSRGALFFDEIVTQTRRLVTDVEQGLRELIAAGHVTSDGFQGLREIAGGRRKSGRRERPRRGGGNYLRGGLFAGGGPPGRWSLLDAPEHDPAVQDELAEATAGMLLDRYGVVFRDLLQRESVTLPWRDILRALRRLEARGLVRGGRFVQGIVGEQYALPDAVQQLRDVRREPRTGERITVSAVDPVNLTGIILPGDRVPAQRGRTVTFVDGLPENPLTLLRERELAPAS